MSKDYKQVHVVSNKTKGVWEVKLKTVYVKTFRTQKEAAAAGTALAKKEKAEYFLHDKEGKVREKNSFGPDSPKVPG